MLPSRMVLLVTGALDIVGFGNASAGLYNGSAVTPFVLATKGEGSAVGSLSGLVTEREVGLAAPGESIPHTHHSTNPSFMITPYSTLHTHPPTSFFLFSIITIPSSIFHLPSPIPLTNQLTNQLTPFNSRRPPPPHLRRPHRARLRPRRHLPARRAGSVPRATTKKKRRLSPRAHGQFLGEAG